MSLVERVASGIPRMRDEMEDAGLPAPIFTVDGGFFTVAFKRPEENDPINLEEVIFKIISDKEGMSAPEISALIGKSLKTTKRYLAKLREAGIVEFVGALKTGGYYLKNN